MAAPMPVQVQVPTPVSDVKIIGGWSSPFAMRPRIAFNLKSVNYEFLQEEEGPKSELLLKSNPVYKKIPVLVHGDRAICESLNIVQYIEEYWTDGPTISPSDPFERSAARFWASYVDQTWYPSMAGILSSQTEADKAKSIEEMIKGIEVLEDAFKKLSKGNPYFGGKQIGYVDIAFGSFLAWISTCEAMTGVPIQQVAKAPEIVGWSERFREHDAVKDVMPETGKLVEFAQWLMKRWSNRPTGDRW